MMGIVLIYYSLVVMSMITHIYLSMYTCNSYDSIRSMIA